VDVDVDVDGGAPKPVNPGFESVGLLSPPTAAAVEVVVPADEDG
jgi:hypothetical protein